MRPHRICSHRISLTFVLPIVATFVFVCADVADDQSTDPIIDMIESGDGHTKSSAPDCGEEWVPYGEKCFKFHNDMVGANFHDAITICERSYHAQLATIHSATEAQFINSLLFEKHSSKFSAWIGLVRVSNSSFIWLDRSPLNYTNWAPNEPNNWNSKNFCVVISSETNFRGKWYDVGCTATYVVICEKSNPVAKLLANERSLEDHVSNLQQNLSRLIGNVDTLRDNVSTIRIDAANLLHDVRTVVANTLTHEKNESILKDDVRQLSRNITLACDNIRSMNSMVEINFILIIFIIITLGSLSIYGHLVRRCARDNIDSSGFGRDKLWHIRLKSSPESDYVPSRFGRFFRNTLKRLKLVKTTTSSPLTATYTGDEVDSTANTESIDATSI